MKNINFTKDILPHLIAVALFLLITFIFFKPALLDNQTLSQHDILQWEGGAKELIDYRNTTGEEGLWANAMFSGMPGYLVNVQWSNYPIKLVYQAISLGLPHPFNMIFLAFVSFYILLLSFKVRPYLAMAGAVAFGLSSFMIIGLAAGHNSRIGAIALMPLVLAGVHLVYRNKLWLGLPLTTMALAMQLRVNHLQITYYLLLILLVYGLIGLIWAIREKTLIDFSKKTGMLVAAALLALGTFIGSFWATYEYGKFSIRGKSELTSTSSENTSGLDKAYAFQYSNGIWEPLTLFIPNIYGGASSNYLVQDQESNTYKALAQNPQQANQLARYTSAYWGQQPLTAPYYAGAIIVLFFAIGVVFADKKHVWWLVSISLLGMLLSMGKNFSSFNYFLFDYFPGYNKFRSVTFAVIFPILGMNLLGFLGLEKLLATGLNKTTQKKALIAVGTVAGIALLLFVTGGLGSFKSPLDAQLPVWLVDAMKQDRIALLRADAGRALLLIVIASVITLLAIKNKLSQNIAWPLLTLVIIFDMWSVDNRVFGEDNFGRNPKREFFAATEADNAIHADKDYFRVINLLNPWNDARTSYHHHSIGGYHGAKIRRYQDLIEAQLNSEINIGIDSLRAQSTNFSGLGVLNMLNTKYMIAGEDKNSVIPNTSANGVAWLVKNIKTVSTPDEELASLGSIDTKQTAVVNTGKYHLEGNVYSANGNINLVKSQPNKMEYEAVIADGNAFGVFSEIYYPKGWTATIDGQPAEIVQTNYVLRGMEIPAGKYNIVFEFKPAAYAIGDKIMLGSSLLSVLLLGLGLGVSLKRSL